MRYFRIFNLTFCCVLLLILPLKAESSVNKTVQDILGRKVTVPGSPQRLVALGPGALRILVYLQLSDWVVGVEALEKRMPQGRPYRIAVPQLGELPTIGPGGPAAINRKPDLEKMLAVKPDLIFTTYYQKKTLEEISRIMKVPVVQLAYGNQDGFEEGVFFRSLRIAGEASNRQARAEKLISFISEQKKQVQKLASEQSNQKLKVYAGAVGHRGAHGLESTDLNYLPLKWLPVYNLAADTQSRIGDHVLADKEILLQLDPDFIFIDGGGLNLVRDDYRRKKDFYSHLRAWRQDRVRALFPYNFYTTNVETALINTWLAAGFLFPKQVEKEILRKKAGEIFEFMVGKNVYGEMIKDFDPLVWRPKDFLKTGEDE